jgi:hypothetical protein
VDETGCPIHPRLFADGWESIHIEVVQGFLSGKLKTSGEWLFIAEKPLAAKILGSGKGKSALCG